MAKKSFRPQQSSSPSYPLLREVDRGTIRCWGMVGLMLGGGACSPAKAELPPPGEPPLQRVESKPSPKPDASPDTGPITPPLRMGKPTVPRVEEPKRKPAKGEKAKAQDKKGDAKGKADAAKDADSKGSQGASAEPMAQPRGLPALRGKMPMPRVEEEEKGSK